MTEALALGITVICAFSMLAASRQRVEGGGDRLAPVFGNAYEMGNIEAAHAHGVMPQIVPGASHDPDYLDQLQQTVELAKNMVKRIEAKAALEPAMYKAPLQQARKQLTHARESRDRYVSIFSKSTLTE